MSPEEFKVQQLVQQIGQMAQTHASELAEVHLQYAVKIQQLQDEVRTLSEASKGQEGLATEGSPGPVADDDKPAA